ncbi:MAG: hypothetical protein OEQ13_11880 [Acidobacteriota bacterium]|nr:hypothetical protein [Acidobacteriota bacterium]
MLRPLHLFVCSGNICRSPMAEALAARLYETEAIRADVASAGTLRLRGQPAAAHAVEAMRLVGLDIARHRSRPLTRELVARSSVVIVMAPEHERAVHDLDPASGGGIVRLWEHAEARAAPRGVPDPIGCDLETYVRCLELIESCLTRWLRTVAKGHGGRGSIGD